MKRRRILLVIGRADYCGVKHAVACSNGTAALHLAMLAAGVGPGDRVVTSPITFLASANAGAFVGAEIEFCDVEPDAATLDADSLEQNWVDGTRAVVAVDYAGHPADHERIGRIAHAKGAIVIEDACHAVGGSLRGSDGTVHRIGGLPWVDMATFSFHPVKTMTTGEGGMVTTNRDDLAERLRLFRNHGLVRERDKFVAFGKPGALEEVGPWAYEMHELGYNYRLTDFQCALGLSQLKKLDGFVKRRAEIAACYDEAFGDLPGVGIPRIAEWHSREVPTSWHLYPVRLGRECRMGRGDLSRNLAENGVGSQVHYIPVNRQPFYRGLAGGVKELPVADRFYSECLSLPLYPEMGASDVGKVCETVVRSLKGS